MKEYVYGGFVCAIIGAFVFFCLFLLFRFVLLFVVAVVLLLGVATWCVCLDNLSYFLCLGFVFFCHSSVRTYVLSILFVTLLT